MDTAKVRYVLHRQTCGIVPGCTATCSAFDGGIAIPVTPEVEPTEKKKPKRSAKPKSEQPQNHGESTIETHPAPESTPNVNGEAKPKEIYDWDRTPAEDAKKLDDERIRRTPFPLPNAKTLPFPQFCEYWNTLIKDPVSRYARLYIRRWFPELLPEEKEGRLSGLKQPGFPSEKTLAAIAGPLSEIKILSEVGVGDYTIRLNDTRKPFDQATIVHCEKFATMRDWEHYPPLIDPERLDFDDPANAVYIKWGQSRGIFRKDDERQKDEAEMANAEVVTQLLAQNKQLTEQVVNSKAPAPAPAPAPPKPESEGASAVKAVADLAIAALNRPAQSGADPMKMVEGIAGVVNTLMPKPDTSSSDLAKEVVKESTAANERVFKMQESAINELRQQIANASKPAATAAVAPPPPPTLAQQFQEMETVMGAAKRIARGGSSAAEEEEKPDKLDRWATLLTAGAPIIGQFIQGIFQTGQMFIQTWGTVSYNNALVKNGEPKPPMTTEQKPPEPGKPIPPQGPQPTQEQQAQQNQLLLIKQQVALLIGPLNRALNNSKTGAEFAAMVIEFTEDGRSDYDKMRNVAESLGRIGFQIPGQPGVEQFKNAAAYLFQQVNPGFYQKVATLPTFGVFLEEFYRYDELAQEEEDRESMGGK